MPRSVVGGLVGGGGASGGGGGPARAGGQYSRDGRWGRGSTYFGEIVDPVVSRVGRAHRGFDPREHRVLRGAGGGVVAEDFVGDALGEDVKGVPVQEGLRGGDLYVGLGFPEACLGDELVERVAEDGGGEGGGGGHWGFVCLGRCVWVLRGVRVVWWGGEQAASDRCGDSPDSPNLNIRI